MVKEKKSTPFSKEKNRETSLISTSYSGKAYQGRLLHRTRIDWWMRKTWKKNWGRFDENWNRISCKGIFRESG